MVKLQERLLGDLTEAQQQAVAHREGPLLVLAGPGSGKTTVVTRRVAYLIAGGVAPHEVLALTFTNKAAGEMRQRIEALLRGNVGGAVGGAVSDHRAPTVSTFHSFCAQQLRRHAEAAGLPHRFSIYDDADRRQALKQAITNAGVSLQNWAPGRVAAHISHAKSRLLDVAAYAEQADEFFTRTIAGIYGAYEEVLRANDALDFDDLLLRMARLLAGCEAVRIGLQQRYHYVLIDEYQDTNHAQFVIAHTLAAAHGNICVVGDPDQSIYGWRGANINNILEFEAYHPNAVIVPLGQNFRSTGHLVAAADGLIRHNRLRKHKDLYTELDDGERPTVMVCRDEHHEASMVADFLKTAAAGTGLPWKEMAVLYRINALSRVLEEALRNAGIPYVIARGTAFFERKEVRDALAYLRCVANLNDEISLRRIINTPTRGIGKTTLDKIELHAINRQLRLGAAMREVDAIEGLSTRAVKSVTKFVELIEGFRRRVSEGAESLSDAHGLPELVDHIIGEAGLYGMHRGDTDDDRQRLENLGEVVSAAADFSPPAGPDIAEDLQARLSQFLESIALVSDADAIDPERGTVTLMSLHAAKGLEFDAVALIGLEQNLLPHARAAGSEDEMEEERRLCFVGMTRAKRRLLLTRAAVRTHRGMRAATMASCFLGELPADTVNLIDKSGGYALDERADRAVPQEAADGYEAAYPVGCIVRHAQYGLGRVEEVTPRARGASARVAFPSAGTKTLILGHAPLVRVD